MRRLFALLSVLHLLYIPIVAHSQTATDRVLERFYIMGALDFQNVNVNDSSFDQKLAGFAAGVWLWEGISLEGEITSSYADDSISGLNLDVPLQTSISVRFESPPSSGVSAFIQLGLAHTEIESRFATNSLDAAGGLITTSLTGPRGSIGLVLPINRWLAAEAGITRLIYEDDADVSLFRLALRFTPWLLR